MMKIQAKSGGNRGYPLVALISLAAFAFLGLKYYLGAGPDDCYITLWAGENLAKGHGMVNHNFEPVEISSSLLHTLMVAGMTLVAPGHTYLINKLAGLIAGMLVFVLICRNRERLFPWPENRFIATCLTCATLAGTPSFLYWSLGGLETPFVALLLLWCALGYVRYFQSPTRKHEVLLIIAQCLMLMVRPEAIYIVPFTAVFIGLYTWSRTARWGLLRIFLVPALFCATLAALRFIFFGSLLPNPAYAKTGTGPLPLETGFNYLLEFYSSSFLSAVFGAALCLLVLYYAALLFLSFRNRRILADRADGSLIFLLGLVLTLHLFVLLSGGDWMEYFRFMQQMLPLTVILTLGFAFKLFRLFCRGWRLDLTSASRNGSLGCFVILLFGPLWVQHWYQTDTVTAEINGEKKLVGSSALPCDLWKLLTDGPGLEERVMMLNERYIRDTVYLFPFLKNTLPNLYEESGELVIATPQMGLFPYHLKKIHPDYKLYFIDTRGLCDPHVARLEVEGGVFGLKWGGSLGKIIGGEAGPLSDYVFSKKPNLLYRVTEPPEVVRLLERKGYQPAFVSPGAAFFYHPRIRKEPE
ncbi:MAG: hypothetical protein KJ645_01385 [Planctomycetes bacterium]|nr:hypothetical protein [Planctomycetota bacterium]